MPTQQDLTKLDFLKTVTQTFKLPPNDPILSKIIETVKKSENFPQIAKINITSGEPITHIDCIYHTEKHLELLQMVSEYTSIDISNIKEVNIVPHKIVVESYCTKE